MSSTHKYIVYGPKDTLKRMGSVLIEETKPRYHYIYQSESSEDEVVVVVYEEQKKILNSSDSLTLILEYSGSSVKLRLVSTGGRTGFRGSSPSEELSIEERINEFLLDFTKRFGLTIKEDQEDSSEEDAEES